MPNDLHHRKSKGGSSGWPEDRNHRAERKSRKREATLTQAEIEAAVDSIGIHSCYEGHDCANAEDDFAGGI